MAAAPSRSTHDALPDATGIRDVLVVGAGQMGSGIAQVFAAAGRTVWLSDLDPGMLDRARSGIAASARKLHQNGRLSEEQLDHAQANISYVQGLDGIPGDDVQLAVEAIVEAEAPKTTLLRQLDELLHPSAILGSNTSSIPITRLGAATGRPDRVIGIHFMNPVPMLDLVEVIPGLQTRRAVTDVVLELVQQLGKVPVESADSPGFITNRVLMPLVNEAFFCLHEGVGTAEGIDKAMQLGMRHPMGPLALADLIGLDTCLAIMEVLHADLGEDKYRPCPLLRRYVDAGRFGRKSGAGVFSYD